MALIPPLGPPIKHSDVNKIKQRDDLSPTERTDAVVDVAKSNEYERRKRGERRRKRAVRWRGKERRNNERRNAVRKSYQRNQAAADSNQKDTVESDEPQKGQQIDITV